MRIFKYILLFCAALMGGFVNAQSQDELGQLMRNRGEYYFTISIEDPVQIQELCMICSVDGIKGQTVVAYANQEEYDKLLSLGYNPVLETPPSMRANVTMWNGQGTYTWDSYLTYPQFVSMMEGFPSSVTNGASCTLLDLGTLSTSNHRRILGVRLNNGSPEGKPRFLYTSTMHGDEITGMILMLRLINEFCTSDDSRILNILDNVDLFIFPDTNPDGTYAGGNNTVSGATRANGNSKDLNRHFPDFDDGAHPDATSYYVYQDEAQWMMDLAQQYLFTMGGNYHGGAEVMNYPWDTYQPVHPDDAWWRYVSAEYVSNTRSVYPSYMTDTYSSGITNGYAWYTITGSRQDYMNYYGQCREVTVECSTDKTPDASELPNFWNYNHAAMLAYIEQCLNGIHGVVKDANTNQPIVGATITVQNHDALGSSVTSHEVGDFHRPIKGGTWTLVVSKSGYQSQTVSVTVADGQRQNIVVSLTPRDASEMVCYEEVTPTANGSYMMGSLHGNFLAMPTNNGTKITTTSLDVTVKDYGFKVEESSIPNLYSLTANGSQYYIKYGSYYLTRSNNKVTWSTSQSSSALWYVNANGVYQTSSSTNYYLVYNNGAFSISTTNRNNITFYSERSCQPVEYTVTATANPTEGGTIDGAGPYLEDTICTLTAMDAADYQFIHWTENGEVVSTENPYSFFVTGNRDLVAVFASTIPVSINVSANPTRGGSVSGGGEFLIGETCTVTATANTNWAFDNWTEDGTVVSTEPTFSFEVEEERTLVANFSYEATASGNCYYNVSGVSAEAYVLGYRDGATLHALTRNNNAVAASTVTVTPTDYGFSVEEGTSLPQVTLQAYGNSGQQFYIKYIYNNYTYYLARSSNGTNLTWTTSNNSSSARWYINDNGIYVTVSSGGWGGSTTNYYLYYNNGSFALSTSQQNNITFYTEGDCPVVPTYNITATSNPAVGGTVEGADTYYQGETCTLTAMANEGYVFVNWTESGEEVSTEAAYSFEVTADRDLVAHFAFTQTADLEQGWNWWAPITAMSLSDLEAALDGKGVIINSQGGGFARFENGSWSGTLDTIQPGQMFSIKTSDSVSFEVTGTPATGVVITIMHGYNWFGYTGTTAIPIADVGFTPTINDVITSDDGSSATYTTEGWIGSLTHLQPGFGYVYFSNALENKTISF